MKTFLAVSLFMLSGCSLPADHCPTPPEQHPDVWSQIEMRTSDGYLVGYSYVCTGQ